MRTQRWVVSAIVLALAASCLVAVTSLPAAAEPNPHGRSLVEPAALGKVTTGKISRPIDPSGVTPGRINVGYELHRATAGPVIGTILAIEGGPGYATTESRDYYLGLYRPLLTHRNLLLIDARGTGTSSPIRCRALQSGKGSFARAVRRCGRQLGETSDLYGSAFAADDFVAVLDHLGISEVDVYGDSYGTFLGQTFTIRHPDRVRSLTLDAAYPVVDQNPWYPDINRAARKAMRVVCERDDECRANPLKRLRKVADRLKRRPLTGHAFDGDGTRRQVRLDVGGLAYLLGVATYGTTVYEELDTAGRTWLRRNDPGPLLRIAAEQGSYGGSGPARYYSDGAYLAVICNDYPQLWDVSAGVAARRDQFADALVELRRTAPKVFAPFTINEWMSSDWAEFDACINWPRPSALVPPTPDPADFPDVPTLVLVGDLDSITSAEGSQLVAKAFPEATYVEVANVGHVTALADRSRCASDIARRFVRQLDPGDVSCAQNAYPAVRTTDAFPRRLAGVQVRPGSGSVRERRVATAALQTVGDVVPRWFAMYGGRGRGLRGGYFTTSGLTKVGFGLHRLRFVQDLAVSGRMNWNRKTGEVSVRVRLRGAAKGHLRLRWNDYDVPAVARVNGSIGGDPVRVRLPAP